MDPRREAVTISFPDILKKIRSPSMTDPKSVALRLMGKKCRQCTHSFLSVTTLEEKWSCAYGKKPKREQPCEWFEQRRPDQIRYDMRER
jgi:hypothetical protein